MDAKDIAEELQDLVVEQADSVESPEPPPEKMLTASQVNELVKRAKRKGEQKMQEQLEATRAELLHDFFLEETKDMNQHQALRKHPEYALKNAKKYFELSPMQEDIILKHMYPITYKMPKYKESWIVDIIDDYCSLYERTYSINNELRTAYTFLFIFLTIRFK